MKQMLNWMLVVALGLTLASCAKDGTVEIDNGKTDGGSVVFVIKGAKADVNTYANSVDPIGDESLVKDNKIYVYRFVSVTASGSEGTGTYVDQKEITLTSSGSTLTGRWPEVTGTDDYVYYVVANKGNASALDGTLTGMTENDFRELLTNVQAATHMTAPATAAAPLLLTGISQTMGISGTANVTLRRSVARFDLVNNVDNFTIKEIHVTDAKLKGKVFGLEAFETTTYLTSEIASLNVIDASAFTYETEGTDKIKKSVFYLYPTTVGSTAGTTGIAILGNFKGVDKLYYIHGPADIIANSRYKLVVSDNGINEELKFSLEVSKWDEGTEEEFEKAGNYKIENMQFEAGAGNAGNLDAVKYQYIVANDGTDAKFSFTVKSSTAAGVTITPVVSEGTAPAITMNHSIATVITYGVPGYVNTFTFEVAGYTGTLPFQMQYKITEPGNSAYSTLTIRSLIATPVQGTPAFGGILAVDPATGELNLDGVGYCVYFKWGSTIAIQGGPIDNVNFNAAKDILWAPAGFDMTLIDGSWASVPYATDVDYPSTFPAENAAAGLGDPCKLASKGGIVGGYKMPTGNPYNGGLEIPTLNADLAYSVVNGVEGLWYNEGQADAFFYPAAEYRAVRMVAYSNDGPAGLYWTSTPANSTEAYRLTFTNDVVRGPSFKLNRGIYAMTIRCVPE